MDLQNMLRKQALMAWQKMHYFCELLLFNSLKISVKHTGKLQWKRCQVTKGEEKKRLFSCILWMLTPLRKVALKSQLVPYLLRIISLIVTKGSDLSLSIIFSACIKSRYIFCKLFWMLYVLKKPPNINNKKPPKEQKTFYFDINI